MVCEDDAEDFRTRDLSKVHVKPGHWQTVAPEVYLAEVRRLGELFGLTGTEDFWDDMAEDQADGLTPAEAVAEELAARGEAFELRNKRR